jgi:hypothetical protein
MGAFEKEEFSQGTTKIIEAPDPLFLRDPTPYFSETSRISLLYLWSISALRR